MKLIIRGVDDVQVLTPEGKDITREMHIVSIRTEMRPMELPRIFLECENWEVYGDYDYESVAVQVNHMFEGPAKDKEG